MPLFVVSVTLRSTHPANQGFSAQTAILSSCLYFIISSQEYVHRTWYTTKRIEVRICAAFLVMKSEVPSSSIKMACFAEKDSGSPAGIPNSRHTADRKFILGSLGDRETEITCEGISPSQTFTVTEQTAGNGCGIVCRHSIDARRTIHDPTGIPLF